MADPCSAAWPIGSFSDGAGFGAGMRRVVDPFAIIWWPADALGCPSVFGATNVAAALLQLVPAALDEDYNFIQVVITIGQLALGQQRVSAWNGGAAD